MSSVWGLGFRVKLRERGAQTEGAAYHYPGLGQNHLEAAIFSPQPKTLTQ